ncbi:3'(2'),5'-bisphosphate nucleotidase 1 [Cylas formicarius]|uniref:3'(2'),5'-bisphosphate nucleotidase 1 n=1 Tax=Cylas formicarius TaxID=197179 RepID=UPI0029586CB8|nr:3'(2'),5'-bisphosphate nucleotidase 1 [Cylas formicarius]XP_060521239.1 3'(2'),5'-bisphosphate nucleotidase 1 [Cylas formicarius]XP_060521249.1 3'(2'),5'-bisphosphate nucleotidase 1 [Cylas formicarius]XP_060521257.1 3'(2'),5'-bisphosphate nucleotidase 1 [Cylas formicarius]
MAQQTPLVLRLLASSTTLAGKAGKIIKDVMKGGDLGIIEKGSGKNDLQTEADRSAQRCIVASLVKLFPDVTIIGEEGPVHETDEVPSDWIVTDLDAGVLASDCPDEYVETDPKDIVVWVDPLDGTSEYAQGLLDHVTVLIGLAIKGKPVGGVIHQPYHNYKVEPDSKGRTLWGLVGLGVGGFIPKTPPTNKFIITTTRMHADELVDRALEALKPDEIIRVGGAGHKVLTLLEGKAHAYVFASKGCKKWDTCAPEGLLRALGGKLTDIHGREYDYSADVEYPNAQGVFATSRHVDHDALINRIPKELKDKFPR